MSTYSVDRVEDGLAVLVDDDGYSHTERIELLPNGIKEGVVLRRVDDGYVVDTNEEQERRNRALSLQDKLRQRTKK